MSTIKQRKDKPIVTRVWWDKPGVPLNGEEVVIVGKVDDNVYEIDIHLAYGRIIETVAYLWEIIPGEEQAKHVDNRNKG